MAVSQVLRIQQFSRRPEDYAWLAMMLVNRGEVYSASVLLSHIPRRMRSSNELLSTRLCISLAGEDWSEAASHSEAYLHGLQYDVGSIKIGKDEVIAAMLAHDLKLNHTGLEHHLKCLQLAIDCSISEGLLIDALVNACRTFDTRLRLDHFNVKDASQYPLASTIFNVEYESMGELWQAYENSYANTCQPGDRVMLTLLEMLYLAQSPSKQVTLMEAVIRRLLCSVEISTCPLWAYFRYHWIIRMAIGALTEGGAHELLPELNVRMEQLARILGSERCGSISAMDKIQGFSPIAKR
jgi:hypothetical protein